MIDDLLQSLRKTGIHTPNNYIFEISFPSAVLSQIRQQRGFDIDSDLFVRVNRVTLPGDAVKLETRLSQSRETQSIVTDRENPTNLSFSIILSEDLRERQYFEIWSEYMYGKDDLSYQPKFLDMYAAPNATLYIGNKGSEEFKLKYQFTNIFPISVSEIEMSYEERESFTTATITMMYESWNRVRL